MKRRIAALLVLISLPACIGNPSAKPAAGTGSVWGYVRLVRREGVKSVDRKDPVYADHRLPELELVDYRRPGFAVVYLEGPPSRGGVLSLELTAVGGARVGFRPERAAVGIGGKIVLRNSDAAPHTISCPNASLLRELKPGEELVVEASQPGPWTLFALGETDVQAMVFAAPGPYAVISEDGSWTLKDVPPGAGALRAWHPRLPGTSRNVQVVPGVVDRVDLEVGVDNLSKETSDVRETVR